jgi:rhodanese-related sulfurtransferase
MELRENKTIINNKTVVLIGFALIFFVILVTFFRWNKQAEENQPTIVQKEETFQYRTISFQEIQERTSPLVKESERILIVDIREIQDYQVEHIVGSKNIPLSDLASTYLMTENYNTVVILGNGIESENIEAVKILNSKNISNFSIFSGGFFAWKKNGGQTISQGDPNSFIDQSKISSLSPEILKSILSENYDAYILDVRSRQSFSQEHIPQAVNIPLEELENLREEIPLDKEIVVYGKDSLQGFEAGVRLYDMNFFATWVMEGGFSNWKERQFEIER